MRLLGVLLLLPMALTSLCANGQRTEADLSARLIGKPLQLRGFFLDDKLHFDAKGQPTETYRAGSFTESAIDVSSVKISGDHLRIEGQRVGLKFDKQGVMTRTPIKTSKGIFHSGSEMITLDIDGQSNTDFTAEVDAIFADDLSQIAPSLPSFWQRYAMKNFVTGGGSATADEDAPAAKEIAKEAPSHVGGSVKPPRVIRQVDPKFSELARSSKFSGRTQIYLWVGPDGVPSHMAIVKPSGLGLDERAVEAVAQYRFAPAMRDGEPVKVDLYIDVNFVIY